MHRKRPIAVVTAFLTAAVFPAATASAVTPRIYIPWTEQTVFAMSPSDSYVAEWMGLSSGWTIIGGPASHIYAGSAGVFATDPTTGDIAEYNGTPGSWTVIGGPGDEFVEAAGHLYGLAPDDSYVAEWNGPSGGWTIVSGPAAWINGGPYGLLEFPESSDDTLLYNGTPYSWTDISGPAADVVVGANTLYRMDENDSTISQWAGGTNWTPILTVGVGRLQNIVAGDDGLYVDFQNSPQYEEYDGTPNEWSVIGDAPSSPTPMVESRTSLYGVGSNSQDGIANVDIYSGSGTTWTVIGGPADPRLAAGA
jgi:hypothetical protein